MRDPFSSCCLSPTSFIFKCCHLDFVHIRMYFMWGSLNICAFFYLYLNEPLWMDGLFFILSYFIKCRNTRLLGHEVLINYASQRVILINTTSSVTFRHLTFNLLKHFLTVTNTAATVASITPYCQ